MKNRKHWSAPIACAGLLWLSSGTAAAEVVRFRYVLKDAGGNSALVAGASGATGERQPWMGGPSEPFYRTPTPTHIVTFVHTYTGQRINVPFTFPDSTPRMEHRANRITYNYGGYQIHAVFNPDGSVTTIYNSGVLRPIAFR
jgi:hypothetical protein